MKKPLVTRSLRTPKPIFDLLRSERLPLIAEKIGVKDSSVVWPGKIAGIMISQFFEHPLEERWERYQELMESDYNAIYKHSARAPLLAKMPPLAFEAAENERITLEAAGKCVTEVDLPNRTNKICVAALISELCKIGFVELDEKIRIIK